ncbi:hypothetical protein LJC74_00805 [Eubacteriales bacterium OttesenSCG-928-A19]|nr:hypothetical protein [Eubacteriales bacterium OttesenSCG-928-A19]
MTTTGFFALLLAAIELLTGVYLPGQIQARLDAKAPVFNRVRYGAFAQPAEQWTERFLALNADFGLPFSMAFERSGGAGEDTHIYDGITADSAQWLRVYTYPYDERIRSVELYQDMPEDASLCPEAVGAFLSCASLCVMAALPDISDDALAAFMLDAAQALSGRTAAVMRLDGLQCVVQVQESLYADFLPTRYALLIAPAPEAEAVEGRPTYATFQTDARILLSERSQSRGNWQTIEVTGRDAGEYRYDMFTGAFTPLLLMVYTDTGAPYALQAFSGRFMMAEDDEAFAEKLETYIECFAAIAAHEGFHEPAVKGLLGTLRRLFLEDEPSLTLDDMLLTLTSGDGSATLALVADISAGSRGVAVYTADATVYYHGSGLGEAFLAGLE